MNLRVGLIAGLRASLRVGTEAGLRAGLRVGPRAGQVQEPSFSWSSLASESTCVSPGESGKRKKCT